MVVARFPCLCSLFSSGSMIVIEPEAAVTAAVDTFVVSSNPATVTPGFYIYGDFQVIRRF